jgi:hypothetical protein
MSNFIKVLNPSKEMEYTRVVKKQLKFSNEFLEHLYESGIQMIIGEKNIGEIYPYYNLSQGRDAAGREYKDVPCCVVRKGTALEAGKPVDRIIIYINICSLQGTNYASCNVCIHELGHAIDFIKDYSKEKEFIALCDAYVSIIFDVTEVKLTEYLSRPTEFFAETFAMYCENEKYENICHHTPRTYFRDPEVVIYDYKNGKYINDKTLLQESPKEFLKTKAKPIYDYFEKLISQVQGEK